jgi:hypothetical protein
VAFCPVEPARGRDTVSVATGTNVLAQLADYDRVHLELEREHLELKRQTDNRFARIEAQMAEITRVLTEHSRTLVTPAGGGSRKDRFHAVDVGRPAGAGAWMPRRMIERNGLSESNLAVELCTVSPEPPTCPPSCVWCPRNTAELCMVCVAKQIDVKSAIPEQLR